MLPSADGGIERLWYSGPRAIRAGVSIPVNVSHRCQPTRTQLLPICSNVYVPGSTGILPCIIRPVESRMTDCRLPIGRIKFSTTVTMNSQEGIPDAATNSRGNDANCSPDCAQQIRIGSDVVGQEWIDNGYRWSAIVALNNVIDRRDDKRNKGIRSLET